jgi:hypothetical protein
VSLIAAAPGIAEMLAAVPNETAVALTETGHGFGGEGGSNFAEAAEWFR